MSAPTTTNPVSSFPKRSWRRFTLRALFLVVLAAGIFFGWVAYRVRQFHEQAAVIADFRSRGFGIETAPVSQAWFWRTVAGDAAVNVKWADLLVQTPNGSSVSGPSIEDLKRIRTWTSIGSLQCYGSNVNDNTITVVCNFRKLHTLRLLDTAITGAGLEQLESLSNLATLSISYHSQDSSGDCNSLNDGFIRLIGTAKPFVNIQVMGIHIREDVLGNIAAHCTDLKGLDLEKCGVNDRGLAHLQRLSRLHWLGLPGNASITDNGLRQLYGLHSLKTLILSQTSVSENGVRLLRKRLPKTNIVAYDLRAARK